jgi:hypothetical protein
MPCRLEGCQHQYDAGLNLVKNACIETSTASDEPDPAPPPILTLERSQTWPTSYSPPKFQWTLGEESTDDDGNGGCSDSDSEGDEFPLDADADFPLAPNLRTPSELCLAKTPDELIYQCTWAGGPIGGDMPARIAARASAQPMTLDPPSYATQCRQTAPDAVVYPHGSGFQQWVLSEGLPAQGGNLMMVQQPNGAQGPAVTSYFVGTFGHPPVEAAYPPPANAPRLDGLLPRTSPPPADAAAGPAQGGEQPPPAAPEGGAISSTDRYARARAAQAPAPGLQWELNSRGDVHRVRWTVRTTEVSSTNRELVSHPFELNVGGPVSCRLILCPKVDASGGSTSFKRAKGKGVVMLKCTDSVSTHTKVKFHIAVCSAASENRQPRGPVTHDFLEKPIAHLPTGSDIWNFKRFCNESTDTFTVCLDILPASD